MSRGWLFPTITGSAISCVRYRSKILVMLNPLRIVIIDDYEDSIETLVAAIEDVGPHAVSAFATAEAALAAWLELRPELALIDIGLLSMDGCELARRVSSLSRTYLVAVTGYNRPQDLER